jgi:hypothetical protein
VHSAATACAAFDRLWLLLAGSGVGYPVDYYLYVTDDSNANFCNGMISAIGATCQLGGAANRPILGVINLCPR